MTDPRSGRPGRPSFPRPVRLLASAPAAFVLMAVLAASLATGTVVEARRGAEIARMLVYDQGWFRGVLVLLAANILLAVVVRWPLRRSQLPFACVHAGLLLLLAGALVTHWKGVEGTVEIPEGGASASLRTSRNVVRLYHDGRMVWEVPVERGLRPRRGLDVPLGNGASASGWRLREVLPFARSVARAVPDSAGGPLLEGAFEMAGSGTVPFRLGAGVEGLPGEVRIGPLRALLDRRELSDASPDSSPGLLLRWAVSGDSVLVRAESGGKILALARPRPGGVSDLPGGLRVSLGAFLPRGSLRDSCLAVEPIPGEPLPASAVRVAGGPWPSGRWIPLGSAAQWSDPAGRWILSFELRRLSLPFALRLDRFRVGADPGGGEPAGFESALSILDPSGRVVDSAVVSMNRPCRRAGFILCQAGFSRDPGRPAVTVLSANRDPGRPLKYAGALVAVASIGWYVWGRSRRGAKEEAEA